MEMATTRKSRRLSSRWSQERELAFLEHLALSSNVAASERVAKLTPGTAYRQRRKVPEFSRAWDAALREGYGRLEEAMLTREQFDRVKAEMEASFAGSGNAGRPMLLEGRLKW
jgi:phage portal protein BeeE